ncbi:MULTISPECIES: phage tail assembly chaperone [Hyphobacterium]|uniref:Phage tail assembly chaperone n=1 Tax=Hyphobacterium vulgare TaxID=1736751 RepID=A0ABV6ZUV5_9PROT
MGITPRDFWQLSLKEWRALTQATGPAPLGRDELEALRARFPDAPTPTLPRWGREGTLRPDSSLPNPRPSAEGGHAKT